MFFYPNQGRLEGGYTPALQTFHHLTHHYADEAA